MLTVNIGPRLTASPAHKRAAEWTRQTLASYGLDNARLEAWKFGRGWTMESLTVEMIEPRYLPLIGYADGWSPSTNGEIAAAPVFLGGKSPEAVAAMSAQLKGAIVMQSADPHQFRSQGSPAAYRSELRTEFGGLRDQPGQSRQRPWAWSHSGAADRADHS